ncbi:MAG: FKBP-type peptidyl-prolyl cis-trans isomerase [Candidatus Campbellbacteria bacterium]|nr:FKBP-type peptidyl-prolyl cis-trans isomerase [Candidatus Campbellbacteria bacterium]
MATKINKTETVIAIIVIGFLLFIFGYFNLQGTNPQVSDVNNENEKSYIPSTLNRLPSEDPSGFAVFDQREGEGRSPTAGDTVRVHYTGVFEDGSVFDSSLLGNNNEPLKFKLGEGPIIPGFQIAVLGMREGGTRLVKIPPELAYASVPEDSPYYPLRNSTLYFEIFLIEILDEE